MILFFILGTFIGSFLNVIIIRLPKNKSIVTPRSHCPNCKEKIPFYLNIPIISYTLLRGKCKYCKNKISSQYILVEVITGVIFYLLFLHFPDNPEKALLLSLIFCCLIIISVIDFYHFLVPSLLILILLITLIPYSLLFHINLTNILWGAIAITSYLGGSAYLISIIKKNKEILGFGDILLSIFIGAYLGILDGLLCLFIASIIGLLYALCNSSNNRKIPFATCLSISFSIIVFSEICFNLKLFLF